MSSKKRPSVSAINAPLAVSVSSGPAYAGLTITCEVCGVDHEGPGQLRTVSCGNEAVYACAGKCAEQAADEMYVREFNRRFDAVDAYLTRRGFTFQRQWGEGPDDVFHAFYTKHKGYELTLKEVEIDPDGDIAINGEHFDPKLSKI